MDADVPQRAGVRVVSEATDALPAKADEHEKIALKPFLLAAVLWLPLSFFLWFALRSAVVYPVIRIVEAMFASWMPELLSNFQQEYHHMLFSVTADVGQVTGLPASRLLVDLQVNVLPYCFGIAVLMGLSIATPISWARTFGQLGIGFVVMWVLQAFGVMGEVLKKLAYEMTPAVAAALQSEGYANVAMQAGANAQANVTAMLAQAGLKPDLIALWYQFGFLILPSISAVILWILFNRRFIEGLWLHEDDSA